MTAFLVELGILRRRDAKTMYARVTAVYRYFVCYTFRLPTQITHYYALLTHPLIYASLIAPSQKRCTSVNVS